jgi:hypothetical protein
MTPIAGLVMTSCTRIITTSSAIPMRSDANLG